MLFTLDARTCSGVRVLLESDDPSLDLILGRIKLTHVLFQRLLFGPFRAYLYRVFYCVGFTVCFCPSPCPVHCYVVVAFRLKRELGKLRKKAEKWRTQLEGIGLADDFFDSCLNLGVTDVNGLTPLAMKQLCMSLDQFEVRS